MTESTHKSGFGRTCITSRIIVCLIVLIGVVNIPTAFAQQSGVQSVMTVPGPAHSFARYKTPKECAASAMFDERVFWRDRFFDTISIAIPDQIRQPSTIAAVRKCLNNFPSEHLAPRDLFGLGQAHVIAQEYEAADRAFALVAAAAAHEKPEQQAWVLYNIVDAYVSATPPRIHQAESYLRSLDSLGIRAAPERTLGYVELARMARLWDSVTLQLKFATAAVKAAREIPLDRLKEYSAMFRSNPARAYYELAWAKARTNDPNSAVEYLELATNTLSPLTKNGEASAISTADLSRFKALGKPAPPVPAHWRFIPPDNPGADPKPGYPSLVVLDRSGIFEHYAVLQRLLKKFVPQGVGAVYSTQTRGYVENKIVSPDSEAVLIRDYYFHKRKIPMVIAIARTDFDVRTDGVYEAKPSSASPYEIINQMNGRMPVFLIDKKGILRIVADLTVENEPMLSNMLTELLAEQ